MQDPQLPSKLGLLATLISNHVPDRQMSDDGETMVWPATEESAGRALASQAAPSFMEQQQFQRMPSREQVQQNWQPVDLPVHSGKLADKNAVPKKDTSPFAYYEPDPNRVPETSPFEKNNALVNDLRMREAAAGDFLDTLDRTATAIQKNPFKTLLPLTQAYTDMESFERSIIETGRKLFGSGATFTQWEMDNILKQIGPFYGPKSALRGMTQEERLRRLQNVEKLFVNKVDKMYGSVSYRRKRVPYTGPDGTTVEVDALELSRLKRLAENPDDWAEFVDGLKNPQ